MSKLSSVLVLLAPTWIGQGETPLFTSIGDLPGGGFESRAYGVSSLGQFVVGASHGDEYTYQACRWSDASGLESLGVPCNAFPAAVSDDGSVIVGCTNAGRAFVWMATSGAFTYYEPNGPNSDAVAVSADGDFAALNLDGQCYRWSSSSGLLPLGSLPGDVVGVAKGMSDNGTVIVGFSVFGSQYRGFVWSESAGMVDVGRLPSAPPGDTFVFSVSGDGLTAVGVSGDRPFRWSLAEGMTALDVLPGDSPNRAALCVSNGAGLILAENYVWIDGEPIGTLESFVTETAPGASVFNLSSISARGVSSDGLTIVGENLIGENGPQGWVLFLSYVETTNSTELVTGQSTPSPGAVVSPKPQTIEP